MPKVILIDCDGEIWKDVIGYEGLYRISSKGNVISLPRLGTKGKLMIFDLNKKGYRKVRLCKNSKLKLVSVHRLVAISFISNPKNKPEVNHKDGNKINNNVSNLEWVTAKENTAHAMKTGLKKMYFGETHPSAILSKSQAMNIYNEMGNQREIAKKYNIHFSTVNKIKKGKIWKTLHV